MKLYFSNMTLKEQIEINTHYFHSLVTLTFNVAI